MKRVTKAGEFNVVTLDSPRNVGGLVTNITNNLIPSDYPCRLNNYVTPPNYEVRIEQFEEYAYARLQLLRAVENAAMRYQREDELAKAIKSAEDKWMPLHSNESAGGFSLFDERRRDQASHFILRIRFANEMSKERSEFLKQSSSHLFSISTTEKDQVVSELRKCSPGKEQDVFFKVPFEYVPDLVSRRGVYLRGGWAYVPKSDSFSIVITKFRENLEHWMERTARELPAIRDERIMPLLQLVKTSDSSISDTSRGFVEGKLTAADLDSASVHFPLCMLQLYQQGIGLPLEEAIIFWRKLFVPKCGEDGFNKNYLYNVRHNYGQEGKRANYGPYSCSKVITGPSPSTGDHHGCPFRHLSPEGLQKMLSNYAGPRGVKLNETQQQEILDLSKGSHCQSACTRLFEYTRKPEAPPGHMETFAYPSKFFEASVRASKGL